jgi:hypothetical protein
MKNYFPFTDYDFYAYLTSGGLLLSVLDFAFNNALLLTRPNWSFVQIVMIIAAAYVTGHIIATFAQLAIETFVVSKLIAKPIKLQLGFKEPNLLERIIGLLVGRYYGPMETSVQKKVRSEARTTLSKEDDESLNVEEIFQAGFQKSFSISGARSRIDGFLNQYGFCRNIAFVALVSTIILICRAYQTDLPYEALLIIASFIVFIGMFIRFVKFLASFQAEVIRTLLK